MTLNTTNLGMPKVIHWFDWSSTNLNIFEINNYRRLVYKLLVYNTIPVYS